MFKILGGIFVLFALFVYSCITSCDSLLLGSIVSSWFVAVDWGELLQYLAT